MFKRQVYKVIFDRVSEPRRFIQILSGPRQTGKTTLARQLIDEISMPSHYASADEPTLKSASWIEQQWETARIKKTIRHFLFSMRFRRLLDGLKRLSACGMKIPQKVFRCM